MLENLAVNHCLGQQSVMIWGAICATKQSLVAILEACLSSAKIIHQAYRPALHPFTDHMEIAPWIKGEILSSVNRVPRNLLIHLRSAPNPCRICHSCRFSTDRSAPSAQDPVDHCLHILRTHDHPAVLQVPFWPAGSRSAFVAIKAFNVELNLIPQSISTGKTLIGKIRYQWWRDAIEACYDLGSDHKSSHIPSNHPVVAILRHVIQNHKLSKYFFNRMIDAQENHYLHPHFDTIQSMVKHAQSTNFSLLALLLQSLNSPTPPSIPLQTTDHALSHLANFISISTFLHLVPHYYQSKQISLFPSELMECSQEEFFRLARGKLNDKSVIEKVQATIVNLATLAWSEMSACRDALIDKSHDFEKYKSLQRQDRHQRIKLHSSLMPLFLLSTPSRTFLNRLEKSNFNPFDPKLQYRDWKLPFEIWYDSKFRKV
ncbi:hypothetical protein O181_023643 [Austropuccinia psidii MF-1]|uniref:Uncharacterized protein n=1 Tax=Austropuccinia psidii MF-1 TaxID=1389203 RepID=A0A9Q3CJ70_9BASI|nr:hypothetical protein [Austropuccinia psidii MF-1]